MYSNKTNILLGFHGCDKKLEIMLLMEETLNQVRMIMIGSAMVFIFGKMNQILYLCEKVIFIT